MSSNMFNWFRHNVIPLILIVMAPNFSLLTLYISAHHGGSFHIIHDIGLFQVLIKAWQTAGIGNLRCWIFLTGFTTWAALSIYLLGGKQYNGPPTASNFTPVYKHSGFRYYVISLLTILMILSSQNFSSLKWYYQFLPMAGALNLYGLMVSLILVVKGYLFPSPGEFGSSGYPIFDFYWGMELYPRIGKWFDIKLFTNSRFGLMLWQLIVLTCWKAQYDLSGWNWSMTATTILQTIYLAKFYWWEDGYMKSLDIILDRAGFYICWGCIYIVPTFYTLTSVYMVNNSPDVSYKIGLLYLVIGIVLVSLNYWSDYQRLYVRNKKGKCLIWGSEPKIIRATYFDGRKKRQNILLASGFWGISRHINYIFELASAFLWELPALFSSFIPYFYVFFLTFLLIHRSHRDEKKCSKKYGNYWKEYCKIAKYRIIPFIY